MDVKVGCERGGWCSPEVNRSDSIESIVGRICRGAGENFPASTRSKGGDGSR